MFKRSIFLLLICIAASKGHAQSGEQEASLKAVFIYNFTSYIEWDTSSARGDFFIGVVGNSPVTKSLYDIARTKSVRNRKIVIKVFNKPEEIEPCQILFIPDKNPFSLFSILDYVGRQTLTISEQPGYAKMGTAFNFIIQNDKLRFEANLKAIYQAGLKAGSQLLKLARIVD